MAVHHRPSNAVHFFKIMLKCILREEKLRIPNKFMRIYGGGLPNPVFLKPPDGTEWKVYWKKHNGKAWFEKGWKEFAKHYSLDHGHLLLFKYELTSHFEVLIFDESTLEIDCPFHSTHDENENSDQITHDSAEILDELLPCQKVRPKSPSYSPQPHKKIRSCTSGELERVSSLQKSYLNSAGKNKLNHSDHSVEFLDEVHTSQKARPKMSINAELDSSRKELQGRSNFTTRKCPHSEATGRKKPLTDTEKARALHFRSENPSFQLRMQPTYVNGRCMAIPAEFAKQYLTKKQAPVLLRVLDGRTWSVKYCVWSAANTRKYKIQNGWSSFAKDNNLKVGDVCDFVLTNSIDISFTVLIFRAAENPSCSQSQIM